jgi:hypothetical protein
LGVKERKRQDKREDCRRVPSHWQFHLVAVTAAACLRDRSIFFFFRPTKERVYVCVSIYHRDASLPHFRPTDRSMRRGGLTGWGVGEPIVDGRRWKQQPRTYKKRFALYSIGSYIWASFVELFQKQIFSFFFSSRFHLDFGIIHVPKYFAVYASSSQGSINGVGERHQLSNKFAGTFDSNNNCWISFLWWLDLPRIDECFLLFPGSSSFLCRPPYIAYCLFLCVRPSPCYIIFFFVWFFLVQVCRVGRTHTHTVGEEYYIFSSGSLGCCSMNCLEDNPLR